MTFKYSNEAKKRISEIGIHALNDFIDEISQPEKINIYKKLPSVQGFRKGTPLEFKEKQKRLLGHLNNPQLVSKDGRDWDVFFLLWKSWAKEKFGDETPLHLISEDGSIFFKEFANKFPNASREDIDRLFMFSGFSEHEDLIKVIGGFRTSANLARDRMLDEIPIRQNELEESFKATKKIYQDITNRVTKLEKNSDKLTKKIEDLISTITQISQFVTSQKNEISAISKRVNTIVDTISNLQSEGKKRDVIISNYNSKFGAVSENIEKLISRGKDFDITTNEVESIKKILSALCEQEANWNKNADAVNVLTEQVDALNRILLEGSAGSGNKQQVQLFECKSGTTVVNIYSIDDAYGLIISNLQSIGVAKGYAANTGRQILAALIAGQLIQFSGSMADLVIDAVATAVSGSIYHEWRVPVGLTSDDAASYCIDTVVKSSNCLLLKGANLSAFEVYGTAIRDIVMRRPFDTSNYGRVTLLASWRDGPAVFPDGGLLAELGPVFNTDEFPMRGLSTKRSQLRVGCLAKDSWMSIDGREEIEYSSSIDEFRDLLNEVSFKGSNLWRQVVNHAHYVFESIPGGNPMIDHHSLLVKWTIPYAKAVGGPVDKLRQLTEKCCTEATI